MAASSPNWFDILPIETNQNIASFLEYDRDICIFRLICKSTLDAIDADNCSFWRRRFFAHFEKPVWTQQTNTKYKAAYQIRRHLLKHGAVFKYGGTERERRCLEIFVALVADSFSGSNSANRQIYESKNLQHIQRFLQANNLLQIISKPFPDSSRSQHTSRRKLTQPGHPTPLLSTIQVLCAPMLLSFDTHLMDHHYGFPDSQRIVYSDTRSQPLFGGAYGLDINMPFLLHNINFWKYHMMREAEGTLYYRFDELEADERPRWWNRQPRQGEQILGKHWKGSFAFIQREDMDAMRKGQGEDKEIQDLFAGENEGFAFQNMKLEIVEDGRRQPWAVAFEEYLRSLSPAPIRAKTRAQKRSAAPDDLTDFKRLSFRFEGEGKEVGEPFVTGGWMNPLPPQQGIPGWHRMTMMKYFTDGFGAPELASLWAYEGVLMPGGQIMLGRWWCPSDAGEAMYSGPFILWCVDGPKYDAIDAAAEGEAEEGVAEPCFRR